MTEPLDDLMRALHMNPEEEKIAAWLRVIEEVNSKIQKEV